MSVKLIAMDLDGTLMAPDHITVSEKTKAALKRAHGMGIKTVIATGRTLSVTDSVVNQLPFIDYVIYSNGAAVYDRCKGKNIYTNTISPETVVKITDILEEYPVFYEVYSEGCQHAQKSKAKYFTNSGLPQAFLDEYIKGIIDHQSIADFAKGCGAEKINLYYFNGEYYGEIKRRLSEIAEITITSPVMGDIEMTERRTNKGEALRGMCTELGISPDEVMAFGDADNDIEMLGFAKYGVAMANASEECKNAAVFETLSNGEDGIALALERFVFTDNKEKIIVSACLLGENCKYSGGNNFCKEALLLYEKFRVLPVCPESFGGLPIPREPNEIINGRAISKSGEDHTAEYEAGAEKTLYIAKENNCFRAVLKERSPSCGFKRIYDGTFSGSLTDGNGITAHLLYKNGISIYGESEISILLDGTDW